MQFLHGDSFRVALLFTHCDYLNHFLLRGLTALF